MSAAPTWYDVLGVDPTASTDEVRSAWKAAVADLDPTDRRFQRLSEAAAVLLDEDRRAEYDRSLESAGEGASSSVTEPQPARPPRRWGRRQRDGGLDTASPRGSAGSTSGGVETAGGGSGGGLDTASPRGSAGSTSGGDGMAATGGGVGTAATSGGGDSAAAGGGDGGGGRRGPAVWVLAVVGVLAVALVALAAWSWTRPDPRAIESDATAAREVAERAVVPVLSYDYRTLAQGQKEAESYLTPRYRDKAYRPLFATIKENAPGTRTVVTTKVVESAIVRAGEDRVEVLVLVDRPTTNTKQTTPITYEDHVTVTMARSGDGWLVDDMST